jgi:hypothetical protein
MSDTLVNPSKATHIHGPTCGHKAVKHDGHVDYLQDGHLQNVHSDGIDEHRIEVSRSNPMQCTPGHLCGGHEASHVHGPNCGHEAVPHGDHMDYLVKDHLHHPHKGHCDDHGKLSIDR